MPWIAGVARSSFFVAFPFKTSIHRFVVRNSQKEQFKKVFLSRGDRDGQERMLVFRAAGHGAFCGHHVER